MSAHVIVTVITLDENCNVKQCLNCNEEAVRHVQEVCRKNKAGV